MPDQLSDTTLDLIAAVAIMETALSEIAAKALDAEAAQIAKRALARTRQLLPKRVT